MWQYRKLYKINYNFKEFYNLIIVIWVKKPIILPGDSLKISKNGKNHLEEMDLNSQVIKPKKYYGKTVFIASACMTAAMISRSLFLNIKTTLICNKNKTFCLSKK